jgi:hypothetical protein
MAIGTTISSIAAIALTGVAVVGWVIFLGGFGAFNAQTSFFENLSRVSVQQREIDIIPYNSHYIVAVVSPFLFILVVLLSVLLIVMKNSFMPYISIITSSCASPTSCVLLTNNIIL